MRTFLVSVAMFFCFAISQAQSRPATVKDFIRVDSPVIALEHVRVIDGTGAAARADQTIIISGGKIAAMAAAGSVQVPGCPNPLDFTGDSSPPGFVGRPHD